MAQGAKAVGGGRGAQLRIRGALGHIPALALGSEAAPDNLGDLSLHTESVLQA